MSPVNKEFRILNKFLEKLKARIAVEPVARYKGARKKGLAGTEKVVAFYKKHGRWPSRTAEGVRERKLGQRYENLCSKESAQYNKDFRRLAMVLGRTTNNKRKHDIAGFKKQILEFIEKHGHLPRAYKYAKIEGEGNLHAKTDYYTRNKHDMTFLGQVYAADPCHRSGIPSKYRSIINASLDLEKPLVRLV